MLPNYLDTISQKKQTHSQQQSQADELSTMVKQMMQIQAAALAGSQGKSTVILTDQTDLGDKLAAMNNKVVSAIEKLDSSDHDNREVSVLKELLQGIQNLATAIRANKADNSDIIQAINSLKLDPTITVPEPRVPVNGQKVDFSPLQATIREVMTHKPTEVLEVLPDRFDLSRYKAQDLKDGKEKQYVGFVNPEGNWYIIENDVEGNKMRYVFGESGYSKYFAQASSWDYKILDKAINGSS